MATNTNWDSDDDDQDEGQQQQKPKGGLREYAEQQKRENAELKEKLEKLEKAEKLRNVENAVKAKGYDPMVANLVPADIASDSAQVEKWLSDHEKLFKPQGSVQEQQVQDEEVDEDELSDDVDAFGRISRVSTSALPPAKEADTLAAIKNAKTRDELDGILRKFGNTNVG